MSDISEETPNRVDDCCWVTPCIGLVRHRWYYRKLPEYSRGPSLHNAVVSSCPEGWRPLIFQAQHIVCHIPKLQRHQKFTEKKKKTHLRFQSMKKHLWINSEAFRGCLCLSESSSPQTINSINHFSIKQTLNPLSIKVEHVNIKIVFCIKGIGLWHTETLL